MLFIRTVRHLNTGRIRHTHTRFIPPWVALHPSLKVVHAGHEVVGDLHAGGGGVDERARSLRCRPGR
jgi:hypothetical protein